MDPEAETLARAIGVRVRHERLARGWTLDALAAEAEVSRRMVVNVEQGVVNPSVGTLLRLSDALGIGLPSLVQQAPALPRSSSKTTPAGGGATLWTGEHGGRAVLVAGTEPPDVVELWDWTLEPGERHESEAHTAGTRELLHVLDGAIEVEVDGEVHELGVGDALSFDGDVDHAYGNRGEVPARFSLAVFEPGVGATHRTEHGHA
jgi:transcriptional regulator with XRE-family HTH domain